MKEHTEEEVALNPVCSEAVFRFFTTDPKEIQQILQHIADEVYESWKQYDDPNAKRTIIPLFEKAESYNIPYHPPTNEDWEEHFKIRGDINARAERGEIIEEEGRKLHGEESERFQKKRYPIGSWLSACAGLGDNEAIVTLEQDKGAFRLNIGNNDISDNRTGWIEKIEAMNLKVEEAERCEELYEYARDCCCGIVFFGEDGKVQRALHAKL